MCTAQRPPDRDIHPQLVLTFIFLLTAAAVVVALWGFASWLLNIPYQEGKPGTQTRQEPWAAKERSR